MHSTTSCDCDNLHCRSQRQGLGLDEYHVPTLSGDMTTFSQYNLRKPQVHDTEQLPINHSLVAPISLDAQASPKEQTGEATHSQPFEQSSQPRFYEEEFPCYTQSPESPDPIYTQSFLQDENANFEDAANAAKFFEEKTEDENLKEPDSDDSGMIMDYDKKESHQGMFEEGCKPPTKVQCLYDSCSDDDSETMVSAKVKENEIECSCGCANDARYDTFFFKKFKRCNQNCNISISHFYIKEIEKLSGTF